LIRTERSFDSSVEEVRAARLFAQDVVAEWGLDPDDAVLVVGELAANSQRHARSEFNVSLDHVEGALLVEVTDACPDIPEIIDSPPDATSGRGLVIVDRVARAWGTRGTTMGGKTVWVELDDGDRTQNSRPGAGPDTDLVGTFVAPDDR
jgi:anti-sigma regulatory factor (Ser/Thr protein kinase)